MGSSAEKVVREAGLERLRSAATAQGVDPDRLRTLAGDLQSLAESVRTVDQLVFEYRKAYGDVVAARTETTYYLVVPPHVWTEFTERLDADRAERRALEALHRAWLDGTVESEPEAPSPGWEPLVLLRR